MNKLKKGSQLFLNSQKKSTSDPSSYLQKINEKSKDTPLSKMANNFLNIPLYNQKLHYPISSPQTANSQPNNNSGNTPNSQSQQQSFKGWDSVKTSLGEYKTQLAIVLWVSFLELLREIYVKTKDKVSDRIVDKILGIDNDSPKNDSDSKLAFDSIPSNFGPIDPDYYQIDAYFDKTHQTLKDKQVLVISGPAGVGKSSFSERYAQLHYKESGQFHSFNQCDNETVQNFYRKLLGGKSQDLEKERLIQLTNQFFRKIKQEILLVFDDVEDLGFLEEYLNSLPLNVKVIITSRSSSPKYANLNIEPFSKLQSRSFVEKLLQNKTELLDQFVEIVGNAPLDLKVASRSLKAQKISLEQFLSEHQNIPQKENDLFYKQLFQKLARNHSNAWKLLQYISKMDPEFISYSLLEKVFENDEIASWTSKLSDSSAEPDFNVISFFKNNCKGKELSKNLQLLESWGLLEPLRNQETNTKGCKTHCGIQIKVLEFSNKHQELSIQEEALNQELIRGIIQEYQYLRKTSEQHIELLIYPHAQKLQEDFIKKFLPFTNIQEGAEFLCLAICKHPNKYNSHYKRPSSSSSIL